MAGKVAGTTGIPAFGWNPLLPGSVIEIDVNEEGTRFYASGYFLQSGDTPATNPMVTGRGQTATFCKLLRGRARWRRPIRTTRAIWARSQESKPCHRVAHHGHGASVM